MVMDRPLSPQCVGREFVRQYYTLLNEAPEHLHRFYNNNSSFIHGGVDSNNRDIVAVVGQRQIHQRIQQLNFRDCHAKITQVDSQATLGNGVVVQVSGELSNAGQPMRRFSQTFVLAPQNPKKYYVHNDIFRYQDMLTDEDVESELARSEAEEDQEPDGPENEIHQAEGQTNVGYYTGVTQVVNGTGEPKVVAEEAVVTSTIPIVQPQQQQQQQQQPPQQPPPQQQQQPPQQPPQPAPQPVPQVPAEPIHAQQYTTPNNIDVVPQPQVPPQEAAQPVTQNASYVVVEMKPNPLDQEPAQPYHNQVPPQQSTQPQTPQPTHIESVNEPKTYATLVKSGTQVGGTVYYNSSPATQQVQPPQPPMSPPPVKTEKLTGVIKTNSQAPKPQRSDQQRNNFAPINRPQNSDDNGNYGSGNDGDRRRNTQYSDSHQLFIGNLPHNATEMDLRDLFGKFGTIVDLRILSKPGSKGPGGLRVPNYGFIIFEDVSSVQSTLNAKPIHFPDEYGVKLNVEEKKARRGGEGGGGGGPRGGGGSRGGGPGGMMRGGPGGMGGGPPRGTGSGTRGGIRFNPNNRGR
ncbi:ras GTPase-activating protein-binding protein 2 isoform X1 [Rhodnius prolixus]|uniref:Putative ras gtpase-activating protein-binding protein 1 rhodnius neglectus n=2 Tax=Rhodnius TaxID=13248 RepID=A0A4P6D653_RHOPR